MSSNWSTSPTSARRGPTRLSSTSRPQPVEPTDLYIVAGVYGRLPPLPHLLGAEGAGRVSAVGRNVKYLKEGDRCMVPPLSSAWVNKVKAEASFLRPLPSGDVNQLSMLGINPLTAYLLLTEFRPLKAGDWIIQNGANSSVGRAVIPIAKARGIRTVSVVRRLELVDEMTALGGDVVLIDGLDLPRRIAAATDKAKIELALDSVGGLATQRLLDFDRPARHGHRLQRHERRATKRWRTSPGVLQPADPRLLGRQLAPVTNQLRQVDRDLR